MRFKGLWTWVGAALCAWTISASDGGAQDQGSPAQDVERSLDQLESRALERPLPRNLSLELQNRADRRVLEQRLRTLQTQAPRSPKLPVLERQLDRLDRPAKVRSR